jgi:hypothetical protein
MNNNKFSILRDQPRLLIEDHFNIQKDQTGVGIDLIAKTDSKDQIGYIFRLGCGADKLKAKNRLLCKFANRFVPPDNGGAANCNAAIYVD